MNEAARERQLMTLADAILEGRAIDWDDVGSSSGSDSGVVQKLRLLSAVAAVHRSLAPPAVLHSKHETLAVPSRWGRLDVLEHIGRGSFGDVYRAWDPYLDREVALKLVVDRSANATNSPVVEEGRLLARVRHSNVLSVYGAERIDNRAGIWTEFVRGETLAAEAARRGPMSAVEAARIAIDVCGALAAVHEAGLLHRDVKAQNIFRDQTGRVVLGDFGTGIELADSARADEPLAGTPRYLAPEIFDGQPPTTASDLYSVGVLLYLLVTGEYPVPGRTLSELRLAHRSRQRLPLAALRAEIPRSFQRLVEGLLSRSPRDRPRSAALAQAAFQEWVAASGHRRESLSVLRGSRSALVAAAAAVVAIAGVALWALPWRHNETRADLSNLGASTVGGIAGDPVTTKPSVAAAAPTVIASERPLSLPPGAWILLAAVENKTGDAFLDGTIESILERELEFSEHVRVVQRDRWEDALLLSGIALDSPRTAVVARQVARTDNGIAALVEGAIEKTPRAYTLSLNVVDVMSGQRVDTLIEHVTDRSHLPAAVRRLTLRLRRDFGEDAMSIDTSRRFLSMASLPSVEAFSWYARAAAQASVRTRQRETEQQRWSRWREVERLLSLSVAEDPDFVRALTLRAWAIFNQARRPEECLSAAERAVRLSPGATPQERYFALGSFHDLRAGSYIVGEALTSDQRTHLEAAVEAYEALLALQPDHYYLFNNLRTDYERLARRSAVAVMMTRVADAQPNSFRLNTEAASELVRLGNVQAARRYAARAQLALTPTQYRAEPMQAVNARFLPAYLSWLEDNPGESLRLTDQAAAMIHRTPPEARQGYTARLVAMYLALGRLNQAEALAQAASDQPLLLAYTLRERNDLPRLREHMMKRWTIDLETPANGSRVEFLLPVGMLDEAVRDAERFERLRSRPPSDHPFSAFLNGQIEMARGRGHDAIPLLQSALERMAANGNRVSQSVAQHLANALDTESRVPDAIRTLERTSDDRPTPYAGSEHTWIQMRAQLARLYRKNGQVAEARTVEAQLIKLLAVADADHPLVRELTDRRR